MLLLWEARWRPDMPDRTIRVVLLGSYNGQDSLGDVCLLRSVVAQLACVLGNIDVTLHSHTGGVFAENRKAASLKICPGLQSVFWWWRNKWRHTHLPERGYTVIAALAFPLWLTFSLVLPGSDTSRALRQLALADVLFIFGGTNFSRQWFRLNIPYYILSAILARCFGARVYWGPQQYGPMTHTQQWITRMWRRLLIRDFRVRNVRCLDELGVAGAERDEKLAWDEVYSNTALYPQATTAKQPGMPRRILLNVRGGNLATDEPFGHHQVTRLAPFLRAIAERLQAGYTFFSVSGESFCDDERSYQVLADELGGDIPCELSPRFTAEHELIELASKSDACISMSFHGCILAGMAGIPSVPITDGEYYDYKYADFRRYGDGRETPVIQLQSDLDDELAAKVVAYVQGFDAEAAAKRRAEAAAVAHQFYEGIARDCRGEG